MARSESAGRRGGGGGGGTGDLPRPLTFFVTARERERIVRGLGALHEDRVRALLMALRRAGSARRGGGR